MSQTTAQDLPMLQVEDHPAPVARLERRVSSGMVGIWLDGQIMMSYEQTDVLLNKYCAVLAANKQWANQTQIAHLWDVSRRSVVKWMEQYRRAGVSGLSGHGGRPPRVTQEMKTGIVQMRSRRMGIREIGAAYGISRGSVCEVLYGRRRLLEAVDLPGFKDPDSASAEQQEISSAEARETVFEGTTTPRAERVESADLAPFSETNALPEPPAVQETDRSVSELDMDLASSPDGAHGGTDPLNRSQDRLAAYLGMIEEAKPLFAEHDHVEALGSLLALALFFGSSFLGHVQRIYVTFGPAFYGLRSVFATLFLMAVQRIRNPERLDSHSPLRLGRLLGLDRSPSLKTLRAKLKALMQRRQAANLMNVVARDLVEPTDLPGAILFVDGHVQCFYGKGKVGHVFSTSKNRVVKGATDYWVNLPDGTPLLCLPTAFNEPLNRMLPRIVLQAKKVCGGRKLTVVFDRGGADSSTYEWLIKADCDLIAYHKNPADVDLAVFEKKAVTINQRLYDYAPYEREAVLSVYQGKGRRRHNTGRVVRLREIIIRRPDEGTTHVITTLRKIEAETAAGCLFGRWTQENFFKYMLDTYELDHLYTYAKRKVPAGADHPNPEYTQLQKQVRRLREQIGKILGRNLAEAAHDGVQQLAAKFAALHKGKPGKKIARLASLLADTTKILAQTPPRESTDDYLMLESESRLLGNLVKCAAYRTEGTLASMVSEVWRGVNGNQRGIVDAFMKTAGTLRIEPNRLRIILQPQSTPVRTRILEHLCRRISAMNIVYPNTSLLMTFEVATK